MIGMRKSLVFHTPLRSDSCSQTDASLITRNVHFGSLADLSTGPEIGLLCGVKRTSSLAIKRRRQDPNAANQLPRLAPLLDGFTGAPAVLPVCPPAAFQAFRRARSSARPTVHGLRRQFSSPPPPLRPPSSPSMNCRRPSQSRASSRFNAAVRDFPLLGFMERTPAPVPAREGRRGNRVRCPAFFPSE